MKTKAPHLEKNKNEGFAFMPDMVLEHLNHAKPKEFKIEPIAEPPTVQKVTIFTDPEIPELDSFFDSFDEEQKQNKMY